MQLPETLPVERSSAPAFTPINRGYNSVFRPKQMSIGLVVPLETYDCQPVPTMERHLQRVQLAEHLGFSAVWLRDVPFNVPTFGDAGQLFDPFVYLGYLAGQTESIALGVSSIVLPLRHPAHVGKAAASADVLSGGRLILGVASGDRPQEYPALNLPFENRGERFRDSFAYLRQMENSFPVHRNGHYGTLDGSVDLLPKPVTGKLPLLITGGSRQDPDWLAKNGDGWMLYPRNLPLQDQIIREWRSRIETHGLTDKPVMQPLHIDLADDPGARPYPIHLGFHLGMRRLVSHLKSLRDIGVNHLALNLRFNQADIETSMKRLADELLPEFH